MVFLKNWKKCNSLPRQLPAEKIDYRDEEMLSRTFTSEYSDTRNSNKSDGAIWSRGVDIRMQILSNRLCPQINVGSSHLYHFVNFSSYPYRICWLIPLIWYDMCKSNILAGMHTKGAFFTRTPNLWFGGSKRYKLIWEPMSVAICARIIIYKRLMVF